MYSPFVAAGWSGQAERNLRPAQWLGLLKIHSVWGAEFFYTGFFSLRHPFQPSENWCWQAMMPAYAQALSTQFADFFYRGTLVMSTTNTSFSMNGVSPGKGGESPLLWAGAPNILALARELDGAYLIAVTIQRQSNNARNLGSIGDRGLGRLSRVHIPGLPTPVEVMARPQGSVYVYRNDSQTGKFVLTQLDAWHGAGHPLTW